MRVDGLTEDREFTMHSSSSQHLQSIFQAFFGFGFVWGFPVARLTARGNMCIRRGIRVGTGLGLLCGSLTTLYVLITDPNHQLPNR